MSEAPRAGRASVVRYLRSKGAKANGKVTVPQIPVISLAALRGNLEVARMLLAHGADPHSTDISGSTPLMWAAASRLSTPTAHGGSRRARSRFSR